MSNPAPPWTTWTKHAGYRPAWHLYIWLPLKIWLILFFKSMQFTVSETMQFNIWLTKKKTIRIFSQKIKMINEIFWVWQHVACVKLMCSSLLLSTPTRPKPRSSLLLPLRFTVLLVGGRRGLLFVRFGQLISLASSSREIRRVIWFPSSIPAWVFCLGMLRWW